MELILLIIIFCLIAPAGRAGAGNKEMRQALDRSLGELASQLTEVLLIMINFVYSCIYYIKVKRMQFSNEYARKCIMEDLLK